MEVIKQQACAALNSTNMVWDQCEQRAQGVLAVIQPS